MLEIELRDRLSRLAEQTPPSAFLAFQPSHHRRPALVLQAAAAIAVLAVAYVLVAHQLAGHGAATRVQVSNHPSGTSTSQRKVIGVHSTVLVTGTLHGHTYKIEVSNDFVDQPDTLCMELDYPSDNGPGAGSAGTLTVPTPWIAPRSTACGSSSASPQPKPRRLSSPTAARPIRPPGSGPVPCRLGRHERAPGFSTSPSPANA
jgi:hypothetical protein